MHRVNAISDKESYDPSSKSKQKSIMNCQTTHCRSNEEIRDIIKLESRGYDINSPMNESKRHDYLSWDDYFLAVACLSAKRSKDPAPRGGGGACVVDALGRIVGIGYDGFPRECSDDCLPWASRMSSNDAGEEEEI